MKYCCIEQFNIFSKMKREVSNRFLFFTIRCYIDLSTQYLPSICFLLTLK